MMKKVLMIIGLVLLSTQVKAETYTASDNTLIVDGASFTLTEIKDKIDELRAKKQILISKRTGLTNRITSLTEKKNEVNIEIDDYSAEITLWVARKDAGTALNLTKVSTDVAIASLYE